MKGKLFVVATPIGNLKDITFRAVETLKSVTYIIAEDTRVSKKLLNYLSIQKKLISNFKGNEGKRVAEIVELLENGEDIALISDAGTPLISDPGTILVRSARERGIDVIPIPGPSSLTTILSVSGFNSTPFIFYGFFPKRKGEIEKIIKEIKSIPYTFVFFESPKRIKKTLTILKESSLLREILLGREMTKKFEEYLENPEVEKIVEKGEFCVVLSPPRKVETKLVEKDLIKEFKELINKGYSKKDAVKEISKRFKISKNLLYNTLISKGG